MFGDAGGGMDGPMRLTFLVCLAGMALLFVTLWKYEMTSKHAAQQLRAAAPPLAGDDAGRARRPQRGAHDVCQHARSPPDGALMPALQLTKPGKYVAAAYGVFLALLLVYVAIMALKLSRIGAADELNELAERGLGDSAGGAEERDGEPAAEEVAR